MHGLLGPIIGIWNIAPGFFRFTVKKSLLVTEGCGA